MYSYGLSLTSLRLLSDQWQNVIGPLLFNIFVCDLFLILDNTYFANYADDYTPYTINQNTDFVTKSLEELSIQLLSWFKENNLKLNLDAV